MKFIVYMSGFIGSIVFSYVLSDYLKLNNFYTYGLSISFQAIIWSILFPLYFKD